MSNFSDFFKNNHELFKDCNGIKDINEVIKTNEIIKRCSVCLQYKLIKEFKKKEEKIYKCCSICAGRKDLEKLKKHEKDEALNKKLLEDHDVNKMITDLGVIITKMKNETN